ncbi:LAMI_0H03796g1_1 [Lachancea mirantina]|uniref:V-type proton ATPase subunit H n=1 Tax=Lachancea mirantina TaxID=1230905 RepID=A0A1G4KEJ6_9SACH|nr:LAMI_0H03796g1_1 [Lachancea mirantina]
MTSKHVKLLLDSTHFNEIRSAVRSRSVAWDALARSAEVSSSDAALVKALESRLVKHTSAQVSIAESVPAIIHLLTTASNPDVTRAAHNLLADLLVSEEYSDDTIDYFVHSPAALKDLFAASVASQADQTVLISGFNLVSLLIQPELHDPDLVHQYLSSAKFLSVLQNLDQTESCYICVRLLQELVAVRAYRRTVWAEQASFLPTLFVVVSRALESNSATRIAPTNTNNLAIQLQYYSVLTVWLLTFDGTIASELPGKYLQDFLNLLKLVKVTIKEKISRLCIATILNCASPHVKGHKTFIRQLLLLGNALPVLQALSERKYSDEELRQNLETLKELLEETYQELTSFDEYEAELDSKLLVWSPPHVDNGFWSDNVDKFRAQDWKLFKQLVDILKNADNEPAHKIAVQVALSDITHIVELLPESVNILSKLNGKVVIMQLLNHPDSKVKYEALKATQAFVAHTFK